MFPYKFYQVQEDENILLKKYFKGDLSTFVRIGPEKYVLTADYIKEASNIFNIPIKNGDVFVSGYPRSGTNWIQELVWLIANDLNYNKANTHSLFSRYAFLEYTMFFNERVQKRLMVEHKDNEENLDILKRLGVPGAQLVANNPSPCFIKTHLPFILLPPKTLDVAKIVYIARDPRDVAVSFYHQNKLFKFINFTGDFKCYWNLFINDLIPLCPYFENVKQAWEKRHHPNMLFLFYEELRQDMPKTINQVATFFGKKLTQKQIEELDTHLHFDNMKNNLSVNRDDMRKLGLLAPQESFIRKGLVGGWREYFDEEMRVQAERWIAHNLQDTDFRFPHLNNNQ